MALNYIIIGDDEYLKNRELDSIRSKQLDQKNESTNFSSFSPDQVKEIMSEVGTMPFLSEKRIVLINEVDAFDDNSFGLLIRYLENPVETTVLIMTASSLFGKKKIYKQIRGLVKVVDAQRPSRYKLENWIRVFFKKHSIDITDEAVRSILDLKGNDSSAVKSALDKLLSYSGGERVDEDIVGKIVGRSVTERVFKLVDAINAGNALWAFEIMNDLYSANEKPYKITGYLAWHLRIMQKINYFKSIGKDERAIAKNLGYSPGRVKHLVREANKYSPEKIQAWQKYLFDCDIHGKTGKTSDKLALEILTVKLLKV